MTLVTLPSPIVWPGILGAVSNGPSAGSANSQTAAGHYAAYAFVAREDMVVSHVAFRCNAASGSPTIDVRIETLDPATGLPNGLWATNTNLSGVSVASTTNYISTLTAAATITKGQTFCVKFAYVSGTSFGLGVVSGVVSPTTSALPYQILNTGSPAKAILAVQPVIGFGSSSTAFYQVPGVIPITVYAAGAFNNTSSAKRGILFTPPMDCRIIGVRWFNGGATGDYNAVVLTGDASGTELSSSSTAFEGNNNSENFTSAMTVYFDNPVTADAGTAYRVVIEPSSATNVNVSTYTLPSADYFSATPAKSTAVYTAYAGSWTDSTTQLPLMDIIIDQVDDGTGTGGGGVVGVIGS
jgi:hypothetical protein